MKHELELLIKKDAWIAGWKVKEQKTFYTDIVYTLSKKQKMWDYFLKNDLDYFFQEIKLPYEIPYIETI